MIHLRGAESSFLSAWLIKIPGTENAGCDVRRAGGVGLICMSGRLLHLQTGSHWACLSTPLAALLAYGATEGIHEHSRRGRSEHPLIQFTLLWLLRWVVWQLVPFGGFGLLKVAKMKVREERFSFFFLLLYILLILYKLQETSKGRGIRGAGVKIDWDGVWDLGLPEGSCD